MSFHPTVLLHAASLGWERAVAHQTVRLPLKGCPSSLTLASRSDPYHSLSLITARSIMRQAAPRQQNRMGLETAYHAELMLNELLYTTLVNDACIAGT